MVWFRDWEELSAEDDEGHSLWRERVLRLLNEESDKTETHEKAGQEALDIPLWSLITEIQVPGGWKAIAELVIGDEVTDGRSVTRILGKVCGETEAGQGHEETESHEWTTGGYQWKEGRWTLCQGSLHQGKKGWNLITESGVFQVKRGNGVIRSRDFTEVGYDRIQETYPFVLERLRKWA
jgi:hypothetical protein